jgi:hypothetical protein
VSDDCLRLVDIADVHLSKKFFVGVLGMDREVRVTIEQQELG